MSQLEILASRAPFVLRSAMANQPVGTRTTPEALKGGTLGHPTRVTALNLYGTNQHYPLLGDWCFLGRFLLRRPRPPDLLGA